MPTPLCREDIYEYRVKEIFKELMEQYEESESKKDFEQWLWENRELAGELFLNDVDSYMGYPSVD